jgi:3-oxoacyl-ACP reductase-like protein
MATILQWRTMLNVNTEAAAAHNAARLDHLHHKIELNNHANRCVKSAIIEKILDDLIEKIEFQFSSVSIVLGTATVSPTGKKEMI